jgi:hypothetical protein
MVFVLVDAAHGCCVDESCIKQTSGQGRIASGGAGCHYGYGAGHKLERFAQRLGGCTNSLERR